MKTNYAATALALALGFVASTSFAADAGALTREQVQASVLQAIADGTLPPVNDRGIMKAKPAPSNATREAVTAEYLASRATAPKYRALEQDPAPVVQAAAARSRADVRTEAVASLKQRTQDYGG